MRVWFGPDHNLDGVYGLGVVQGAVSGAAELTEVEGRAAAQLPSARGAIWQLVQADSGMIAIGQ